MSPPPDALERFRHYLLLLARLQLGRPAARQARPVRRRAADAAGGAPQARAVPRHRPRPSGPAWLRQILARNLADAVRDLGRAKRDVGRERSLEAALEQSASAWRRGWRRTSRRPASRPSGTSRRVRLAAALERLPEAQREAVVLHHCEGLSLAEIGAHLGRSPDGGRRAAQARAEAIATICCAKAE